MNIIFKLSSICSCLSHSFHFIVGLDNVHSIGYYWPYRRPFHRLFWSKLTTSLSKIFVFEIHVHVMIVHVSIEIWMIQMLGEREIESVIDAMIGCDLGWFGGNKFPLSKRLFSRKLEVNWNHFISSDKKIIIKLTKQTNKQTNQSQDHILASNKIIYHRARLTCANGHWLFHFTYDSQRTINHLNSVSTPYSFHY